MAFDVYTVIYIILAVALLCGFAYLAKWIITTFLPEPVRVVAMACVGLLLLVILLLFAASYLPGPHEHFLGHGG